MAKRQNPFMLTQEQITQGTKLARTLFDVLCLHPKDIYFATLSTLVLNYATAMGENLSDRLEFVNQLMEAIEGTMAAYHKEKALEEDPFIAICDHKESQVYGLVDSLEAKYAQGILISGLLRIIRKEDETLLGRMKAINYIKFLLETIIADDHIANG